MNLHFENIYVLVVYFIIIFKKFKKITVTAEFCQKVTFASFLIGTNYLNNRWMGKHASINKWLIRLWSINIYSFQLSNKGVNASLVIIIIFFQSQYLSKIISFVNFCMGTFTDQFFYFNFLNLMLIHFHWESIQSFSHRIFS